MSLPIFRVRCRRSEGRVVETRLKRKRTMDRSNLNGFKQKVIKVRQVYLINRFVSFFSFIPPLPPFSLLLFLLTIYFQHCYRQIETKQTNKFSLHFKLFLQYQFSIPTFCVVSFRISYIRNIFSRFKNIIIVYFCTFVVFLLISNGIKKKKKKPLYL